MRWFCGKENTGCFYCAVFRGVEGPCCRQTVTVLPRYSSPGAGPLGLCWETPVFSRKPGAWGVVIKGGNSSLLQPAFKIDPIRPVSRNPGEPSTSAHHRSTLPRMCACSQTGNSNSDFSISHNKGPGTIVSH